MQISLQFRGENEIKTTASKPKKKKKRRNIRVENNEIEKRKNKEKIMVPKSGSLKTATKMTNF